MENQDQIVDVVDSVETCAYSDGYYLCQSGVFTPVSFLDVPQSERVSWLDGEKPPVFRVSNQLSFIGMLQNALMKFAKWIFFVVAIVTVLAVIGHVVS